jgi:hypothetical protein
MKPLIMLLQLAGIVLLIPVVAIGSLWIETRNSRLIWINESGGRIYITSDYMGTVPGRLWKHWAVRAESGDGLATVRINGIRYQRKLVCITDGPELDGAITKKRAKYRSSINREAIE